MRKRSLLIIISILVLSSLIVSNANDLTLTLDKDTYAIGDTIKITFTNAAGNENAWFAIYPAGEDEYEIYPENEKVWLYANSGTKTQESVPATDGSVSFATEDLDVGNYRCTYFPNSSYTVGMTLEFELVEKSATEEPGTETETNPGTFDSFIAISLISTFTLALILIKRKEVIF